MAVLFDRKLNLSFCFSPRLDQLKRGTIKERNSVTCPVPRWFSRDYAVLLKSKVLDSFWEKLAVLFLLEQVFYSWRFSRNSLCRKIRQMCALLWNYWHFYRPSRCRFGLSWTWSWCLGLQLSSLSRKKEGWENQSFCNEVWVMNSPFFWIYFCARLPFLDTSVIGISCTLLFSGLQPFFAPTND